MTTAVDDRGKLGWTAEVLAFWFGEVGEHGWFQGGLALDQLVVARFRDLHGRVAAGVEAPRLDSPLEVLAAIIVLDQFSRHLFRGSARAYECDLRARQLTRHAIAAGLDKALEPAQRMFLYMPLQHSEDRADQAESVRLYETLGNAEWVAHAAAHREVIERFGRFPHRNAILERESTPAELEALAAGAAW
ncbi:MAG TPA: DUF924 family protein [Steroidobacteraceae bacterium]|nr:DUF924 family protein [Steroidobacteraceae bacterium]